MIAMVEMIETIGQSSHLLGLHRTSRMARYRDHREDSGHGKTLMVAAGVLVGVLAGAAVAQRLGGLKGIQRRLRRGRGPLYDLVRETVSPELLAKLLRGGDGLLDLLLPAGESNRRRRTARYDAALDEYEVEDYERAAAGLDDEDEEPSPRGRSARDWREESDLDERFDDEELEGTQGAMEDDDAPDARDIEHEILRRFQRNRALRRRPIEIACDDDGAVTLTGIVHSEREQRAAQRLARDVDGVSRVDATLLEVRVPMAT